jgi:hypothetical protein
LTLFLTSGKIRAHEKKKEKSDRMNGELPHLEINSGNRSLLLIALLIRTGRKEKKIKGQKEWDRI